MPTKAYPLGEWIPDNPGGLQIANNVIAIADGYAPVGAPQAVTTPGTSGSPFNGGGAFIDSTGGAHLFFSTTTVPYVYAAGIWGGIGPFTKAGHRFFTQYGDYIYYTTDGQLRSYNLLTSAQPVPTNAPNAIDVAQWRDFVVTITQDNALQWCQFNNPLDFTTGVNQADKQPSLWGQLRKVVDGEYGIAFTDRAVVRATYVGVEGGLDIIWQFDEISAEVGLMAPSSVCKTGRLIFFLSERGFMMCDGNEVVPIADEKFNRWFFRTYSRADIVNIWGAIDPRASVVCWSMPGSPGKIIAYNWVLKKATTFETDVQGIYTGYTAGTDIDHLDTTFGNLDAMTISLDDPSLQGGNPLLLVVDHAGNVNALTGAPLEAAFRLENVEPTPGARSRIRSIRLVTDATQGSLVNDARLRIGDAESDVSASSMRLNGKFPIRSNGRYNNITVTIPAGTNWTYVQGLEVEFEPGGER